MDTNNWLSASEWTAQWPTLVAQSPVEQAPVEPAVEPKGRGADAVLLVIAVMVALFLAMLVWKWREDGDQPS